MSDLMNQPKAPSDAARKKLEETVLRVRVPDIACALWREVFSEEEKKRLGGDLNNAYANGGAAIVYRYKDVRLKTANGRE
jgi:hypothetical protein